jgi:hypothetical protein
MFNCYVHILTYLHVCLINCYHLNVFVPTHSPAAAKSTPEVLPSLVFREFLETILLVMVERNPLLAGDPVEGLTEALQALQLVTPDTGTRGPLLDFNKH